MGQLGDALDADVGRRAGSEDLRVASVVPLAYEHGVSRAPHAAFIDAVPGRLCLGGAAPPNDANAV